MNIIQSAFQWIGSLPWAELYSTARAFFIILDAVLFVAFIYVWRKAYLLRPQFSVAGAPARIKAFLTKDAALEGRWKKIIEKFGSAPPKSYVLAIIEADNFVDDILKKLGMKGEHMADRLDALGGEDLVSIDRLWRAHRIRNALVHTPGFEIGEKDAKEVLSAYESFLKEIGLFK